MMTESQDERYVQAAERMAMAAERRVEVETRKTVILGQCLETLKALTAAAAKLSGKSVFEHVFGK